MENNLSKINRPGTLVMAGNSDVKPASHVLNAFVYALIYIVSAAIISYTLSVMVIPGNTDVKAIWMPAGLYALLGILFAGFLYAKLSFLSRHNYSGGLTYAFAVFIGVFIASLLVSYVKGKSSVITSLFYSSLFVVPFTIYQTWLFYSRLLFISYNKIWYIPEHGSSKPKATVFLNSIHIKIKIAPMYGTSEQLYETIVPGRMGVGSMFSDFIGTQNSTGSSEVAIDDVSSQDFGWQFFAPSFLGLGTRIIDADLSLDENNIKNNTVVIARRVPKQLANAESSNLNQLKLN